MGKIMPLFCNCVDEQETLADRLLLQDLQAKGYPISEVTDAHWLMNTWMDKSLSERELLSCLESV